MDREKFVIVGSGPAAYTAAIYAARAELSPLLFTGFHSGPIGGQLMTTTDVENFPGFPDGITGPKLMDHFLRQAQRFGTRIIREDVLSVSLEKPPFLVKSKNHELITDCLVIATGATARRLDIPGTRDGEFWQKGVSACAVCDGAMPLFRGKDLFVVGGGDSAMEEALFLTKYAKRVFIVHRRESLRASKIMAERALRHPKICVLWESVVTMAKGTKFLEELLITHVKTGDSKLFTAGGLFFGIGHDPNTAFLGGQVDLDQERYIKVIPGTTQTNIAGVFAAGDVADKRYRQAITAAASGCQSALDAESYMASL